MNSLAFLFLAAALIPVGLWARRNAVSLVSPHLDAQAPGKRQRVIRRGGLACFAVAAGFVTFAIVELAQR